MTFPNPAPGARSFGPGPMLVGKDVQPGTFRSTGGDDCYWARQSKAGGHRYDVPLEDILANGSNPGPGVVTIEIGDVAFYSENCGTWSDDLSPRSNMYDPFGTGTLIVGTDIAPGVWRAETRLERAGNDVTYCYWARLNNFSGTADLIENSSGAFETFQQEVAIQPDDRGFRSRDCGVWTRVR